MKAISALGMLRSEAGHSSIEKAAKVLDVSRIHLAEIERGAGAPSADLLERMSKLYGVSIGRLSLLIVEAQRDYHERAMKRLA